MHELMFTETTHIDPIVQANTDIISSIKHAQPLHSHDFYEFFIITKGRCKHKINGEEQQLLEGTLVFIRPKDRHYYESDGDGDFEFINIPCMKKVVEEVLDFIGFSPYSSILINSNLSPITMLSPLEKENIITRFEKIKLLSSIDKLQARIQVRSLLVEVFTQYFYRSQYVSKKEIPLWVELLLTQMQKKDNFIIGLERMYKLSGRSVGHLNRVFKQYFNATPTEYINKLRLNYAKSLLLATDLSIIEIALEAGFQNLSYFYHLFKKQFNTTPAEFRIKRNSINL